MDKITETVALMGASNLLAAPRATEACGAVEALLGMYFQDNPERTPAQALEDVGALRRVRPLRDIMDTCKKFKALLPQIQSLFTAIMALCPKTTTDNRKQVETICQGGLCQGALVKCLMNLLCPGVCPATGAAGDCSTASPCFAQYCPTPTPTPTPAPTPAPGPVV
jgi:hypothetical protein